MRVRQIQAHDISKGGKRFSLSARERAGVRADVSPNLKPVAKEKRWTTTKPRRILPTMQIAVKRLSGALPNRHNQKKFEMYEF